MKGLAWYSGIVIALAVVYMTAGLLKGAVDDNIYGLAMYIPVLVFFVLHLKGVK